MKLCRTCGAPMEDETILCPMCGAKTEDFNTDGETTLLNNSSDETTVLNSNDIPAYVNTPQQPQFVKQKKKLGKGAIIAIVLGCVIAIIAVIAVVGVIAENNHQNNLDSVINDIEMPDLDIDTDRLMSSDTNTLILGTNKDNVYTNDFADIKFHIPSKDWKLLSDYEIYKHYQSTGANVEYDNITGKTYMKDTSACAYYDMFMINETTKQNIQLTITELTNASSATLGEYLSYMEEGVQESFGDKSLSFENAGIATIGENTYTVKSLNAVLGDNELVQYYIGTVVDNCFVIICITSTVDTDEGFLNTLKSIIE